MSPSASHFAVFCLLLFSQLALTNGHGRLIEPPSRASMWRYGFKNPPNYNDHELFCGGLSRMIRNGGKCGLCGDSYDTPVPRPHEAGGQYGNGIIVRSYHAGQVIPVKVQLTAHHKGYFQVKVCANDNPKKDPADETCFNDNVLAVAGSPSITKYYVPDQPQKDTYDLQYILPKHLTCSQCVFQWTYVAGNNWGRCSNGTESTGCGPQETFRGCADIRITDSSSDVDNHLSASNIQSFSVTVFVLAQVVVTLLHFLRL